tara:strand:+ start:141 stop:740 length:600 start_codon:yes stop_codon:yes gene_type:complete
MKRVTLFFLRGLLTILPLGLTIYLLFLLLTASERLAKSIIAPMIGSFYFPGIGLILTILAIIILGMLVSQPFLLKIFSLLELPFTNLPVIKSIYNSIKSFAEYFSNQNSNEQKQAVVVRLPGDKIEMVGLVTRRDMLDLPDGFTKDDRVGVYLPMSYMVGGYTIFVPREYIKPIKMNVEELMRNSLIAWLSQNSNNTNK